MKNEEIAAHLKFWEDAKPHQMDIHAAIRWLGTSNPWRERICRMIIEKNFTNIYDAGAGFGIMAHLLKQKFQHEFNYKGIEITPKFVNICQNEGLDISLGDLNNINEPDNTYDCVLSLDVLNHQIDFKKQLSELIRISNKLIYVSFFKEFKEPSEIVYKYKDPPLIYHHFDKQEIIDYLNTFDNIRFSFHHAGRMSRGKEGFSWWGLTGTPLIKNLPDPEDVERPFPYFWVDEPEQLPALLPHEDLMILKV